MARRVVQTSQFEKDVKKIFAAEDLKDLWTYLQAFPEVGDIIQGTGGVRKLRWANPRNNKGKRGGLRILYHYSDDILILLLSAYSKSNFENISEAEKNKLKEIVPILIQEAMEEPR